MDNKEKVIQGIKRVLLMMYVIICVVEIMNIPFELLYRFILLFFAMIIGIIIATFLLNEEPLEFFDNFSKWEKAQCSSIMMLIACFAFIAAVISIIKK